MILLTSKSNHILLPYLELCHGHVECVLLDSMLRLSHSQLHCHIW